MLVALGLIGTQTSFEIVFWALIAVGLLCSSPGLVIIAASQPGTGVESVRRALSVLGLWFAAAGFVAGLIAWPFGGVAAGGGILLLAAALLHTVRGSPTGF